MFLTSYCKKMKQHTISDVMCMKHLKRENKETKRFILRNEKKFNKKKVGRKKKHLIDLYIIVKFSLCTNW